MATQTMATEATGTGTLDSLLRDATAKLAAAGRKGGTLHTLPLLYLMGDTNAAKTTAVLRTGWNAELLAGEAMRDGEVCPTSTLNLWYTDGLLIAEAGVALRNDPAQMKRLYAQTRPGSLGSAFKGGTPLRAAVVAVSCERLLGANPGAELQALASKTGEQLRELSKFLGTTVPVYVLFTKADRIPSFAAWARNLSTEEAGLLMGAAPRNFAVGAGGTWAETASASILQSYDSLLTGLASTRLPLLARETDQARAAEAYEFPREMRKLRSALAAFLVELVRPSQLSASPLLRGFYFTGVRAHIVEQVISEAAPIESRNLQDAGATQVFAALGGSRAATPAPQQQRTVAQKTAQWTFLPRFFPHAVVEDAKELAAGGGSTRHASLVQRMVYGTAAALLLLLLIAFTVSYVNNRALEQQTIFADQQLSHAEAGGVTALATETQLQELDALRAQLVQLERWKRDGAPLSYRWGLYHGDQMLAPARRSYFQHFRALLLERTQNNLVQELSALPSAPPPNADYTSTYSALRAYLITTSNPEKSTSAFLAPVLTQHWQNGADLPASGQKVLAQRQFAFYADELPPANPYSIQPVATAVTHARTYLAGFGGFERIYQSMLTAAGKQAPSIDFNAQFPRSSETVVEPHTVLGAFTPDGYTFMQNALAHPDVYFRGEPWVLGDQAPATIDPGPLKQQLASRYTSDYLATWRAFLREAQVVRGRNLAEAGAKLAAVSGNSSPLLALFYTVSHNTAVPDKTISDAFQAPQSLVAPGAKDQYLGPGNKSYVDALLALRGSIQQVSANPSGASDPAAAAPISAAAAAAHLAAQQTAQGFRIDSQGHVDSVTLALMEAPITSADGLVHGLGPAAANAGGKSFCSAMNALFAKSPFNINSAVQASPAEVTALLQPGSGQLWQFYNANLKSLLVQQGSTYGVAPNPPMQVNPAFLHFFNRMADLSSTFFPPGATGPSLTFVMHNVPTKGVLKAVLKVDAQTLSLGDAPKQFTWTAASASSASLTANDLPLTFAGPWAVFEMLNKAKVQHSAAAGTYDLSFALELANTPVRAPDGTPIVVDYELSGPGAAVLAPGAMSGLRCVDTVAH